MSVLRGAVLLACGILVLGHEGGYVGFKKMPGREEIEAQGMLGMGGAGQLHDAPVAPANGDGEEHGHNVMLGMGGAGQLHDAPAVPANGPTDQPDAGPGFDVVKEVTQNGDGSTSVHMEMYFGGWSGDDAAGDSEWETEEEGEPMPPPPLFPTLFGPDRPPHPHHGGRGARRMCFKHVPSYFYNCEAEPALQTHTSDVICESEGGMKNVCVLSQHAFRTPVKVVPVKQLNAAKPCVEGKSYKVVENKLWVWDGCHAQFEVAMTLDAKKCAAAKEMATQMCPGLLEDARACKGDVQRLCGPEKVSWLMSDRIWAKGPPLGMNLAMCMKKQARSLSPQCRGTKAIQHLIELPEFPPQPKMDPEMDPEQAMMGPAMMGRDGPWPKGMGMGPARGMGRVSYGRPMRGGSGMFGGGPMRHGDRQDPSAWLGIWVLRVFAGIVAVWFIGGLVYFLTQRRRLAARRPAELSRLRTGSWTTRLFDATFGSCLPACCCGPWLSALNQAEVHDRDAHVSDLVFNLHSHSTPASVYMTRQALRNKYDMPHDPCTDCMATAFCMPCVNAQHKRELDARAPFAGTEAYSMLEANKFDGSAPLPAVKPASDTMMV